MGEVGIGQFGGGFSEDVVMSLANLVVVLAALCLAHTMNIDREIEFSQSSVSSLAGLKRSLEAWFLCGGGVLALRKRTHGRWIVV
jgi:hypothetical protein